MITSTPTSTNTRDSPPGPVPKPSGVTVSSLLTHVGPRLLMLLVLAASVWLAFAQFTLPAVVPASAPATEFSAERAMTDLRAIAKAPHPMGSPANAAVRAYLLQQIRTMGLQPEVQTTTVVQQVPGQQVFFTGTAHNVIARLKGTASTRAILLDAHYDSEATGPGASDDGSGVVTLLETMGVLAAGPPLKNDVIFVFTDGEERYLLGSRAFATEHPWMQEVGLAINIDAGASGGPTVLGNASQQAGWLLNEFLQAVPSPLASSFLVNLIEMLPNHTDLNAYMEHGSAGLNIGPPPGSLAGGMMGDTVQTLDARSIQDEGSSALALVRRFGSMDLSAVPRAPDEVFFNILPGVVVHYAVTWVIELSVLVVLLFLGVLALGFRRKRLTVGGFALGVLAFPVSLIGTLLVVALAAWALKAVNLNGQEVGLTALSIAVMSALYLWLQSKIRLSNLAAGALVWWALLLLLSSLFFPRSSYLFTWPLLCSVLALGWLFFTTEHASHPWLRAAVLSAAAVPGIVLLTPAILFLLRLAIELDAQLSIPTTPVPLLLVVLLLGLLIPQLALLSGEPHRQSAPMANPEWHPMVSQATESRPAFNADRRLRTGLERWLVPVSALLISVVLLLTAIGTSGFRAIHLGTDSITYRLNADTGQATWLSSDQQLDDWTRQFFPKSTGQGPFQAQAPAVALAAPTVTLLSNTLSGDVLTLRVQVASPRHAEGANVLVEAQGEIVVATLDGKPFDLSVLPESARHQLQFTYYALPDKGFELRLLIKSAAPVKITVQDVSNGLPTIPGMTIRPRPADLLPAAEWWLDPTIVIKSFTFAR